MKRTAACLALALLPLLSAPNCGRAQGSPLLPEQLHAFSAGITDFFNGVIPGPGGDFYGVSRLGGDLNNGAFFKVSSSGVITQIASFGQPGSSARGRHPSGELVYDGSTYFYGVTQDGGKDNRGTVFRVDVAGNIQTLVEFTGHDGAAPGSHPEAGLTLGQDGNLYGMAYSGRLFDGVLFRVSPSGRYEVLVDFTGERGAAPGSSPSSPLLAMTDGSFVGTTSGGGRFDRGVVFRFSILGGYSVAGEFTGDTGALPGSFPRGGLVRGLDETVYGATYSNASTYGALWKLPPGSNAVPFVSLELDSSNTLLGVSLAYLGLLGSGDVLGFSDYIQAYGGPGLFRVTPAGQVFPLEDLSGITNISGYTYGATSSLNSDGAGGILIRSFRELLRRPSSGPTAVMATVEADANTGEGLSPRTRLLVAADGTVFGRTLRGGVKDQGTIFSRSTSGTLTTLLSIDSNFFYSYFDDEFFFFDDNVNPLSFIGSDLLHVEPSDPSLGSVIQRITPGGSVTTVADFSNVLSLPPDTSVSFPSGGLTPDGLGNFYGRISLFDFNSTATTNGVYRLTPGNQIEFVAAVPASVAGSFNNFATGPLTLDGSGNLLGVLPFAGKKFLGLVYKVTPSGQVTKFIEFGQAGDLTKSGSPVAPLLREPSGSLVIPMTEGEEGTPGLVRLSPAGTTPTRLLTFTDIAGAAPGDKPIAPLVRDAAGRIYGMTSSGGREDYGVLYRLEPSGAYTLLHEFTTDTNVGVRPSTGLTLSPDGTMIYGGTFSGGPNGGGTIFRFPLNPQGSATTSTLLPGDFDANSATFKGVLNSNGYGGEYWFVFTEDGGTPQESIRIPLAGFSGMQNVQSFVGTLKGHRNYTVELHAKLGIGAEAILISGALPHPTFLTPNGAPLAADDTILVSASAVNITAEALANDIDRDDDAISIQSFSQGTYGTVTPDPNDPKKLIYTPDFDFFDPEANPAGRDSFTYTITDNFSGPGGPLTATATVNVLSDGSIAGDYAGLLVEEEPTVVLSQAEAIPSANQIAAGFASMALGKARKFTARFQVGSKSVSVKGTMSEGRGTRVTNTRAGFTGDIRPTPGGIEGRITFNGRTLVLRTGQAFAASTRQQRPISAFTMRFNPASVEDPVAAEGLPAGSGFAVIRELKKSRAQLVGVLPDGTPFSKGTVIDGEKEMDFFTTLYKSKTGTFGGQITIDATENIDGTAGTPTLWKKAPQPRDTRFAGGFQTEMTVFGGKYTVPGKGQPPVDLGGSSALLSVFDRGGLFGSTNSRITFTGAKVVVDINANAARVKPKFSARAGTVTGTFIPVKKPVKFRALIVQRDKSVNGFFLGTADTGSVSMAPEP